MSTRHRAWVATVVTLSILGVFDYTVVHNSPPLVVYTLLAVFEVALVCSCYFIAKWRDELR